MKLNDRNYKTARLNDRQLDKVQSLEQELRADTAEDIVLVAYQAEDGRNRSVTDEEIASRVEFCE